MLSNFTDIIETLEKQKAAIDRAIEVLRDFDDGSAAAPAAPQKAAANKSGKKRVLSEAGRQRIAEAARKRWAAARKKTPKKLASAA